MTLESKILAGICLAVIGAILGLIGKIVWDYFARLREPTNEEVRELTRLEGRINAIERQSNQLEITVAKKVDNAVWLERSAKLESFSKLHHDEISAVRSELAEIRKILKGG